jgi:glycerol kinase
MSLEREIKAYQGRVRRARVTFSKAELNAAGSGVKTLSKLFGTIPPDAIILYTLQKTSAAVTDGAAGTFVVDVGDNTTADNILADGDIDAGTTPIVTESNAYVNGGTFKATVTGSVNLSTVTAGAIDLTVFFIA